MGRTLLTELQFRDFVRRDGEAAARHVRAMSQGRKQLLCLARVLLRRPAVVVLDEFTAGLDDQTAMQLQETVHQSLVGATVVQVVHKVSTLRWCNQVVALHHGRVVEQGDPDSLMTRRGLFYTLVKAAQ